MGESALAPPRVTVIVVSYNSARWLDRLLAAMRAQTVRDWRLVLLDNASRPDQRPPTDLGDPRIRALQSGENLGFAAGNNLAAAGADTPFLAFLNPDAFPEPTWLEALLAAAERWPDAGAIGSTQWRADTPGVLDGVGDVYHVTGLAYRAGYGSRRPPPAAVGEPFSACAAAMLVRRDAFEAVGGFDPRYFCYFEDVDLGFRLRSAGWRVLQTPDAVVAHVGGGAAGAVSAFGDFHGARNRVWTFIKCMPAPLLWALLVPHLFMNVAVATSHLMTGRGLHSLRGVLAGLAGASTMWGARRSVQRTASLWSIARAMAWSPLVFIGRKPVLRRPGRTTVADCNQL